jgi:glycerol-3-phosphate dehydrogenase
VLRHRNGTPKSNDTYIHPKLPYNWSEIEKYIKEELVETAEDLLCRRTRCILLHKQATMEVLDEVIQLIAKIKDHDEVWQGKQRLAFAEVAKNY